MLSFGALQPLPCFISATQPQSAILPVQKSSSSIEICLKMKAASTILTLSALLSLGLAAPLGHVEGVRTLDRVIPWLSLSRSTDMISFLGADNLTQTYGMLKVTIIVALFCLFFVSLILFLKIHISGENLRRTSTTVIRIRAIRAANARDQQKMSMTVIQTQIIQATNARSLWRMLMIVIRIRTTRVTNARDLRRMSMIVIRIRIIRGTNANTPLTR